MATQTHLPQTNDPSQFYRDQLTALIRDAILTPGNAMVLGGNMIEEVQLLIDHGYQVTLVDPAGEDLRQAKQRGLSLKWGAQTGFLDIKPWHVGHLDLILDKGTLNALDPQARFAYANRMGRFLPCGSHLAGMYDLGAGTESAATAPLSADAFQRMLGRYFLAEHPKYFAPQEGAIRTVFHLMQRRSEPKKPPKPR